MPADAFHQFYQGIRCQRRLGQVGLQGKLGLNAIRIELGSSRRREDTNNPIETLSLAQKLITHLLPCLSLPSENLSRRVSRGIDLSSRSCEGNRIRSHSVCRRIKSLLVSTWSMMSDSLQHFDGTQPDMKEWVLEAETEYRFELDPGTSLGIKVRWYTTTRQIHSRPPRIF